MNINKQKHQKYTDPLLRKLTDEQMLLAAEVSELNKDLNLIKHILRQKQKSLREINTRLIQKSMRGPFLSVVTPVSNKQSKETGEIEKIKGMENSLTKHQLVCLHGGKGGTN